MEKRINRQTNKHTNTQTPLKNLTLETAVVVVKKVVNVSHEHVLPYYIPSQPLRRNARYFTFPTEATPNDCHDTLIIVTHTQPKSFSTPIRTEHISVPSRDRVVWTCRRTVWRWWCVRRTARSTWRRSTCWRSSARRRSYSEADSDQTRYTACETAPWTVPTCTAPANWRSTTQTRASDRQLVVGW